MTTDLVIVTEPVEVVTSPPGGSEIVVISEDIRELVLTDTGVEVVTEPAEVFTVLVTEPVVDVVTIGEQGPVGATGPQGPQGPTGGTGGAPFILDQMIPATTWTADHMFGRPPASVRVVDSAGEEVYGFTQDTTPNRTVLTFSAAFSGTAIMV